MIKGDSFYLNKLNANNPASKCIFVSSESFPVLISYTGFNTFIAFATSNNIWNESFSICIALIFIMIVLYRIAVRIEDLETNITSKTVDFKDFKVEIYDKINKLENIFS